MNFLRKNKTVIIITLLIIFVILIILINKINHKDITKNSTNEKENNPIETKSGVAIKNSLNEIVAYKVSNDTKTATAICKSDLKTCSDYKYSDVKYLSNNYLIATRNNNLALIDIVDFDNLSVLKTLNYKNIEHIENSNLFFGYINYEKDDGLSDTIGYLLNDNFETISESKQPSIYTKNNNEVHLLLFNQSTNDFENYFLIYNNNGDFVRKSKYYTKIVSISDNYVVVNDENVMKVIDYKEGLLLTISNNAKRDGYIDYYESRDDFYNILCTDDACDVSYFKDGRQYYQLYDYSENKVNLVD